MKLTSTNVKTPGEEQWVEVLEFEAAVAAVVTGTHFKPLMTFALNHLTFKVSNLGWRTHYTALEWMIIKTITPFSIPSTSTLPTVPPCIPYWLRRWAPAGRRGSWWRTPAVVFVVTAAAAAPGSSRTGWGTSPPPCGPSGPHGPGRTGCSYPDGPPVDGKWIGWEKPTRVATVFLLFSGHRH